MFGSTVCKVFLPGLLLATATPARAAAAVDALAFIYDDGSGNRMPYRLFLPPGYDPAVRYPLVLFLHGAGECGVDNQRQLGANIVDLTAATQSERFASFLLAPQSPNEDRSWLSEWSTALVDGIVREVLANYPNIEEWRLYVTGLSMGGFGTLRQIYLFPDRYAAAVPISSGIPAAVVSEYVWAFWQVPIWVFHGTLDDVVPVEYSRDLVEALREEGGDPLYTEYPDRAHNAWFPAYADEGDQLYPWLFSQKLKRPVAHIDLPQNQGDAPLEVCASAEGSFPGDAASIVGCAWDFGDGLSGEGLTACHTYTGAGVYNIKLRVTNDRTLWSEARATVTVHFHCLRHDVSPWTSADVGSPLVAGSATTDGDALSVCAGGRAIGANDGDEFHFVYQEVTGDFAVVLTLPDAADWRPGSRVGLVARESLEPQGSFAAILLEKYATTLTQQFRFRDGTGPHAPLPAKTTLPRSIMLARNGDDFVASTWPIGDLPGEPFVQENLPGLSATLLVGMGACAGHSNGAAPPLEPFGARAILGFLPDAIAFVRGDTNSSGAVDIADAIFMLTHLFAQGPAPSCKDAGDANDDGNLDIADAIAILSHLFAQAGPLKPPFGECGVDPTTSDDTLDCASFPPCAGP